MLEKLIQFDQELFLALNGAHNSFFDFVMFWASDKLIWIPFYLFLLLLVFIKLRWKGIFVLIAIAALITLSDQASVHLFKEVFKRFRPCHEPLLEGMVHLVKGHCGGKYGFVSSHATNVFAIASFMSLFFRENYRYSTLTLMIWASFVAYSRIYLGVHYPGDVLGGALLGGIIGIIVYKLYLWLTMKFSKSEDYGS